MPSSAPPLWAITAATTSRRQRSRRLVSRDHVPSSAYPTAIAPTKAMTASATQVVCASAGHLAGKGPSPRVRVVASRQPGGDRPAHLPHGLTAGPPHRRGALRSRRPPAVRAGGGRGGPPRPTPAEGVLPGHEARAGGRRPVRCRGG